MLILVSFKTMKSWIWHEVKFLRFFCHNIQYFEQKDIFPVASRQTQKVECHLFQLIGDVFALFPRINESLSVSMVLYFSILINISHSQSSMLMMLKMSGLCLYPPCVYVLSWGPARRLKFAVTTLMGEQIHNPLLPQSSGCCGAWRVCWGLLEAVRFRREQSRMLAISALLVLPVNVIKAFLWNKFN